MDLEGGNTHDPKGHCWGGITARVALKLEIFEEKLESERYLKTLKKKRHEMDQLYPNGWDFQQDGSGYIVLMK